MITMGPQCRLCNIFICVKSSWISILTLTVRRSNQSILMEINSEYSLEGLMLKLKLHFLATWCEELTHWKRPWCWERLKAGGEEDHRGWDGWMASPTQWTWVWVSSGSWWWTGKPGVLQSMGSQSRTQLSGWSELQGYLQGWEKKVVSKKWILWGNGKYKYY